MRTWKMESRALTLPYELLDSRAIPACQQAAVGGLVVDIMVFDVFTLVLVCIQCIFNHIGFLF
jgi:hypothetical protein